MLLSNRAICDSKKWRFIKEQEASGLLSSLGLKTPLDKIPLLGDILWKRKDNIWGAYLADMQLIREFNKGIRLLLCVIDIFSKYAWIAPSKDKKSITITNASQKILDESKRKRNKIWVDKGSAFYNLSMKCIQHIMKENLLLLKDLLKL